VFSLDGSFLGQFNGSECADETARLQEPFGIALTSDRVCLVVDSKDACIKRFSFEGKYLGPIGKSVLQDPRLIAVRQKDNLIAVSDIGKNAIVLFDAKGTCLGEQVSSEESPFARPNGTVFDARGDLLFVADEFQRQLIHRAPLPRSARIE
jgi:hypothetical protein